MLEEISGYNGLAKRTYKINLHSLQDEKLHVRRHQRKEGRKKAGGDFAW